MKKSIKNLETKAINVVATVKGGEPGDGRIFYHWSSTISTTNP